MGRNMNIKGMLAGFIVGALCFSAANSAIIAAPGDNNDPLVSKSYVDSRIEEILALTTSGSPAADVNAVTQEVMNRIEYLLPAAGSADAQISYEPLRLRKGQAVIGKEGSEIILRSGTGIGYSSGIGGLVNVTAGTEITTGGAVPVNNLLVVPREDGRGIMVTSDEAWFIVRGGYTLLN